VYGAIQAGCEHTCPPENRHARPGTPRPAPEIPLRLCDVGRGITTERTADNRCRPGKPIAGPVEHPPIHPYQRRALPRQIGAMHSNSLREIQTEFHRAPSRGESDGNSRDSAWIRHKGANRWCRINISLERYRTCRRSNSRRRDLWSSGFVHCLGSRDYTNPDVWIRAAPDAQISISSGGQQTRRHSACSAHRPVAKPTTNSVRKVAVNADFLDELSFEQLIVSTLREIKRRRCLRGL
jgi:hypothetical protein